MLHAFCCIQSGRLHKYFCWPRHAAFLIGTLKPPTVRTIRKSVPRIGAGNSMRWCSRQSKRRCSYSCIEAVSLRCDGRTCPVRLLPVSHGAMQRGIPTIQEGEQERIDYAINSICFGVRSHWSVAQRPGRNSSTASLHRLPFFSSTGKPASPATSNEMSPLRYGS
jgi:hypothetical protein